jgi:hypothetical protein
MAVSPLFGANLISERKAAIDLLRNFRERGVVLKNSLTARFCFFSPNQANIAIDLDYIAIKFSFVRALSKY